MNAYQNSAWTIHRKSKVANLIGYATDIRLEAIENKGGPLRDYASEELTNRCAERSHHKRCYGY